MCVNAQEKLLLENKKHGIADGLIHCPENFLNWLVVVVNIGMWFSCEHHQILNDLVPLSRKELELPVDT